MDIAVILYFLPNKDVLIVTNVPMPMLILDKGYGERERMTDR